MQRVINYGSFLQAYALRELLRKNGAGNISFIDIIPGRPLVCGEQTKAVWRRYIEKIILLVKEGNIISGLKDFYFNRKLDWSIRKSWPILELDKPKDTTFDSVVIGSDEVFNCCQESLWGYSTQLFGDKSKIQSKRVFSYAGSFGYTTLKDLHKYSVAEEIAYNLNNLKAISVRDENSKNIILKLTGKKALLHLDPVLIYGYKKEIGSMAERPIRGKYMIVYTYQGRLKDLDEISVIKCYAARHNYKLVSIMCRYNWCDTAILPSNPIDVLRFFKFAECIVTDTFHGTIFSIITHSRFATFVRPSNINKLHFLLISLGLEKHEVNRADALYSILDIEDNFDKIEGILNGYREETISYLRNNISE